MSAHDLGLQRSNLESLAMLAGVFERVERSATAVDAQQYQVLVDRLTSALAADLPAEGLNAVLTLHPAAAELYENLHYAHAGLCRSPLEGAVAAERQARDLLARLAGQQRA
jgi:hypothetical protein